MNLEIDTKLEYLLKNKSFESLSKAEREFVLGLMTKKHYQELNLFYFNIEQKYKICTHQIELDAKTKHYLLKKIRKEKKVINFPAFNFPQIKIKNPYYFSPFLVLFFFFIFVRNKSKDQSEYLTDDVFNSYTSTIEVLILDDNQKAEIETLDFRILCIDIE